MMLDRRERSGEILAGMLAIQENISSRLWVCMPGIIQSYDASKRTAVIQPAINARVQAEDGSFTWLQMPLLVDCPVVFPGGGNVVMTFPLASGDECLVHFGDRCIDAWWQNGGIQNQIELRMHDLSDGFCMPGPASVPRVEAGISSSVATLRSRDGQALVSLDPSGHVIHVSAPGADLSVGPNVVNAQVGSSNFNLTPTAINMSCGGSAAMTMAANSIAFSGTVSIDGKEFLHHHHSGVTTGGSNTGDVV